MHHLPLAASQPWWWWYRDPFPSGANPVLPPKDGAKPSKPGLYPTFWFFIVLLLGSRLVTVFIFPLLCFFNLWSCIDEGRRWQRRNLVHDPCFIIWTEMWRDRNLILKKQPPNQQNKWKTNEKKQEKVSTIVGML